MLLLFWVIHMNKKLLNILALSFLLTSISSCGNEEPTSNPQQSEVESELPSVSDSIGDSIPSSEIPTIIPTPEVNKDPVYNENYTWPLKENNAYKGIYSFTASSIDEPDSLNLKIDGNPVSEAEKINFDATIKWDASERYPVHSDTVENCDNQITFNDEVLGRLPTDDSKGIVIPNLSLFEGPNVFSVTIGKTYGQSYPYDMGKVHGGLNGSGDDFQIANMRVELPNGEVIKPSKIVFYKPVSADSKDYVKKEVSIKDDEFYFIGDGWAGSLSYDGHSNPRLDIPFRVDYYFDIWTPGGLSSYDIDTNNYSNGEHLLSLYDGEELVLQNNVYFDNDIPRIFTNIEDGSLVSNNYKVECKIEDLTTSIENYYIKIDGKECEFDEFYLTSYKPGQHNLTIYAEDKAGNILRVEKDFVTLDSVDVFDVSVQDGQLVASSPYETNLDLTVYEANKLNYTASNPLNNKQTSSTDLPYDEFSVNVNGNDTLYVTYKGQTKVGESLIIEALNATTNEYEQVTIVRNEQEINFVVDPTKYNINNQVKFKVTPLYIGNGSNRILWSSDTQYLPKAQFTDINYMYPALMEYMVSEYKAGRMSYMVHTGDIVDDSPDYGASAVAEWELATKAFEILDEGEVPYGVCAGNHDVGTTTIDYSLYEKHFGVERYNDNLYYGGSLNNNECHYDLITVGQYDFIVLYLGFGIEVTDQTVSWANKVLQTYSHRNAIVATHGYLEADGRHDEKVNAEEIYQKIVVPNDNVKFVFCGHTDGNATVKRDVNEERYVYEILNCYQFVERKTYSVSHKINGYDCNGEGFIKELTFENGVVNCHTFSPITHGTHPYGSNDDFSITVDLYEADRELTSLKFEAYQASSTAVLTLSSIEEYTSLSSLEEAKSYIALVSDSHQGYGFTFVE